MQSPIIILYCSSIELYFVIIRVLLDIVVPSPVVAVAAFAAATFHSSKIPHHALTKDKTPTAAASS